MTDYSRNALGDSAVKDDERPTLVEYPIPHEPFNAELANFLHQPLTIGGKSVQNRLFLAPMAGLGNIAFRELLDCFGAMASAFQANEIATNTTQMTATAQESAASIPAPMPVPTAPRSTHCGLMFTGMCTARAVPTENPKRSPVFCWRQEELPRLVCQLLGSEPHEMAEAAKRVEAEGFFGVDINMGCSSGIILNRQCGAALLRQQDNALRIVEAVRKSVNFPLFVKLRSGWSADPAPVLTLAKQFADAGVDALVMHPRIAPDKRTHRPHKEHIALLQQAVSIPVFGNGDVFDSADCAAMIAATSCAGVSLGRLAVCRPWIFATLLSGYELPAAGYKDTLLLMLDLLQKHNQDSYVIKLYKRFVLYYCANFSYGNNVFGRLIRGETVQDLRQNIETVFATLPQVNLRPGAVMMGQ